MSKQVGFGPGLVRTLACAAALMAAPVAHAADVTMRMESVLSATDLWTKLTERFAERIKERTGGAVEIRVFANGELSRDTVTQFENIQAGTLDGAIVNSQPLSGFDERLNVFSLPFLARTADEYHALLDGPGKELWTSSLEKLGVVGIPEATSMGGFRQLTNSVRPIRTPEDLTGLTIRMPGSTLYRDIWATMKVNTSSMPFGELIGALETGVVSGQENPLNVIESAKLNMFQKYLTVWNYTNSSMVFAFNEDSWAKLSPEQQAIFREEAVAAAAWHREAMTAVDTEVLARFKKDKAFEDIVELDETQTAAFMKATAPVYDIWRKRLGAELVDAFLPK